MINKRWQGALNKLNLQAPFIGVWQLTRPTALQLSEQQINIPSLCLHSYAKSQVCLKSQWQANASWQGSMTGKLYLEHLATLLPESLHIDMPLDLHAAFQGKDKNLQQAQFNLNSSSGLIRYELANHIIRTAIKPSYLTARFDKNALQVALRLDLSGNNLITTSFTLPKFNFNNIRTDKQIILGQINFLLNNLTPIALIIPDVLSSKGSLQANFNVTGTIKHPLLKGKASLADGEIKIPDTKIALRKIALNAQGVGSKIDFLITAYAGQKLVTIKGLTDLAQKGFLTDATITGDNLLVLDTPKYTFYASPNLRLQINGLNINLTGQIDVPQGVIHILNLEQETLLPEGEVIFIGENPRKKSTPWKVFTNLIVRLGKNIRIDSVHVKGKLTGELTINHQPGQITSGVGRIDIINGVYENFGRQLSISRNSGIIYRRNPINNPFLNFQVVTKVNITDALSIQQLGTSELSIGANVTGTADSPHVTLFSSSGSLSQADILSYLLLGTSSSGASPKNVGLLLQALDTLPFLKKTQRGEGFANQIRRGLGFSEFGFASETNYTRTGEPSPTAAQTSYFVVGKRITPHLYFRYKFDPFTSVNFFQLTYLISKNWSIQAETDGANRSGADILYTIQAGTPITVEKKDVAKATSAK